MAGLGLLEFEAINSKDFPMLQGAFLVFSIAVIVANLLADCLYFFLDPRVQSAWQTVLWRSKRGRVSVIVLAVFIFVAIFGALLAPYDPNASSTDVLAGPSTDHWLGTTEVGSDVFSRAARRRPRVDHRRLLGGGDLGVLGASVGLVGGYFGGTTTSCSTRSRTGSS